MNHGISSTYDMRYLRRLFIGSKWCVKGNKNCENMVSRNAMIVHYRLQNEIFPLELDKVSDISISFTIFSI